MKQIFLNKKGGEEIITPYLFVVWVIIGVGIVAGALIFYSSQFDVRAKEAEILNLRVADCVKENFPVSSDFDIYGKCGLNKELIENSEMYYIRIKVDENKPLRYGVYVFETNCKLKGKGFPLCYEDVYYINKNNKIYNVEILTGSNQIGGRI